MTMKRRIQILSGIFASLLVVMIINVEAQSPKAKFADRGRGAGFAGLPAGDGERPDSDCALAAATAGTRAEG